MARRSAGHQRNLNLPLNLKSVMDFILILPNKECVKIICNL